MFYDRLLELCQENNKKITPVVRELGLSTGGISKWRNGATPDGKTLKKVAEYFQVSVDHLMGENDKKERLTEPVKDAREDEVHAIKKILDNLTREELKNVLSYAEFLNQKHRS